MTEHSYLDAQEHITTLAFDAIAKCQAASNPTEKLRHYKIYQNLCEGACRLRIAYAKTLQQIQHQRSAA